MKDFLFNVLVFLGRLFVASVLLVSALVAIPFAAMVSVAVLLHSFIQERVKNR